VRWLSIAPILIALAAVIACGGSSPSPTVMSPQTITISFETGGTLQVEIAKTSAERAVGLMNRSSLGADAGMLFAFPGDTQAGFWMKDTLVPLSIAFMKADGTIVHIEDMQPQTEALHHSTEPYRYAIEANQGWFASHNVVVGGKAEIPSGITAS
jgi:uncharacterized membrane protein (UPF0127 family)